ncbi:hypothetical protein IU459_05540 [Nocardia amamiensis]|uniref:Uncharacterized protein n=1 Tax=Nocardia amamiensis TaxID=404578 RepID=A0ABS0CLC1_9NOCA|nr:hypothetical protein [Nocardia amamiensis]MBF6297005.1 hypothetical protein [Nocardia amamiensis]
MTVPCGVPADFDAPMPKGASTVTIVGSARLGDRSDARTGMRRFAAAGPDARTAPTTCSTFGYQRIRLVADVIDVAVGSAVTRRSWT